MSRDVHIQRVLDLGLVAIIRSPSSEMLVEAAEALVAGGIDVMEVTFTVPGALDVLAAVRKKLGDRILLGAGTVLDNETARAALLAGAQFIVTPTVNTDVIEMCRRYDALIMPGGFTPTAVESMIFLRREGSNAEVEVPVDRTTEIRPGDVVKVHNTLFSDITSWISPISGVAASAATAAILQ